MLMELSDLAKLGGAFGNVLSKNIWFVLKVFDT